MVSKGSCDPDDPTVDPPLPTHIVFYTRTQKLSMEEKAFAGKGLYGGSLLVPSVQELVQKPILTIPPRYIQPHHQEIISSDHHAHQIPSIDMQQLLSQESTLVNHGVSSSLLEKMKTETQEFFNLPMEEKKKISQQPGDIEGFGQSFVVSEDQKLDWVDTFFLTTLPVQLRKPRLLPKLPSPFRSSHDSK
ncbi:hypothetical protein DVH24_026984 [Malus domestica]|uniref:Non-haem dioxygenase N-terminal domain-containing protein n=1 Tax=Malus domestica TaxID=3750 RepID=A0A498IPN2_MALDO|nr:hypothetical protein DVH24_026984 [Malus domestica]